jgi:sterol desaturase/sphingolipid hydroxylase (fatty acid hydroxylase superfamily)
VVGAFAQNFAYELSFFEAMGLSAAGFGLLYLSFAALSYLFSRVICPRLGLGIVLDKRPLFRGQVLWELAHSTQSILIFGFYGGLTLWLEMRSLVSIDWGAFDLGPWLLQLLGIVIWNEVHFYTIHRTLHSHWLFKKVHWVHHRSTTNTPFTTYSFHWIESLALSSVLLFVLAVYPVHYTLLFVFPVVSLLMNSIGHLNFTIFSNFEMNHVASASRRHAAHHKYFKGNYGFLLPYLDRWFNSKVKA